MRYNFLPDAARLRAVHMPRLATLTPRARVKPDPGPTRPLAISEIDGNLTFTAAEVTAWYALPEAAWAFRPDPERETLMAAIAEQYAGLGRTRLHLRRTTRPFPVDSWRDQLAAAARPLPDVPGASTWRGHLDRAARHLTGCDFTIGQTMIGVTFARRHIADVAAQRIRGLLGRGVTAGERDHVTERVDTLTEALGAFGMSARPATPAEIAWLIYRSVGLGLTPDPAVYLDPDEVLSLTEHVEAYRSPYGSTVRFVNRITEEQSHVAVLTVGRMEPLEVPERNEPWLHLADRAGFPVELSSRVVVLDPEQTAGAMNRRLLVIRNQQRDYGLHGLDAPESLDRLAKRALQIGDQLETGLSVDASRVHGWHRLAVSAPTAEEARRRAADLIRLYREHARIMLAHPRRQYDLCREFVPGQPVSNGGYLRRMPVRVLAGAMPQAASTVGDGRGDPIAFTAGTSRRPVFFDPHYPMEVRERSGLAVVVSEPGGGKSTLMGAVGYLAARRGVQVTLLDPSGPLAKLTEMPELAPYARVLNLAKSRPGTLAPYGLVPTPRPEDYRPTIDRPLAGSGPVAISDDGEVDSYDKALAVARLERIALVTDICTMLLPPQMVAQSEIAETLRDAVRKVPAFETTTLEDLIDELDSDAYGPAGRRIAKMLGFAGEHPLGQLFFGQNPRGVIDDHTPLLIVTMAGLRLPDLKIPREHWSTEEALALPMLHTAHRLTVRRCYGGDMHRRKMVGLDEAHFMQGWSSGRAFLVRLARDSRKWNLAALVASQNPRDILKLDVQNLVSTVFVGRIVEDTEIAAEALRLLRVPTGAGYEQTLAGLSQHRTDSTDRLGYREFVARDVDGRVQKIRVDMSWIPELLDHLNTTPGGTR